SILPCPLSCPLSPLPDSCSAADRSYSITSSARASSVGGTSWPSALAVLRVDVEHDGKIGRLGTVTLACASIFQRVPRLAAAVETALGAALFGKQRVRIHADG